MARRIAALSLAVGSQIIAIAPDARATMPLTKTTQPPPSFQNQPQFKGSLPPITLPDASKQSAVRRLRVELEEDPRQLFGPPPVNTGAAAGGPVAEGEQVMEEVADGATPTRIRQVLNEGLVNSPRVAATRADLGISKSLYAAATQMPNPVFFRDEAFGEGVRRVGPQQTFEPPWKLAFRLLAAKREVQQTKLTILNVLWQFRNDVRRAYTEVVVAQETYQTLMDLSELAHKLLSVTQKRFQSGAVPELDVLKARLAASQADIDSAQGKMRVTRARQQLNIILGRSYNAPISATRLPSFEGKERSELLPDYSVPFPPVSDFITEAFENRLELRINKQALKLNKAQLYNAYGNMLPNPQFAYGQSTSTNLPSGPKLNSPFFTVNAEMPLFTYSQGDIARLKATERQLKLRDAAIKNQITADVTAAYNTLMTARNRLKTYQDHVLADSAEVARLARRSYEVGQSDINATLLAQQANFQVRSDYLNAVSNYQSAMTDLEQSIGEPIE
ncbi:MAG: TolC family protein [Cyanobacteria bacterium SZAS LIN-3]|nr:TolC family protein [Cyanobacteria bacterium SZAS LIN-3]